MLNAYPFAFSLFAYNSIIMCLKIYISFFFFSNFIGRALARSILSTALITGLVVLLNSMNLVAISITTASLIASIPFLLLLVLLWYVVDRIV